MDEVYIPNILCNLGLHAIPSNIIAVMILPSFATRGQKCPRQEKKKWKSLSTANKSKCKHIILTWMRYIYKKNTM